MWEFYKVLVQFPFITNKTELISSIRNFIYQLPHELRNDLRFRIFGNKEILEKSQNWMGTQPNAPSTLKK